MTAIIQRTINAMTAMYAMTAYDIFITFWGITHGWGKEANILLAWIHPQWMIGVYALGCLIVGISVLITVLLFIEYICDRHGEHSIKETCISKFNQLFYLCATWRFITGSTWIVGGI